MGQNLTTIKYTMNKSRRQFLKRTGLATGFALLPQAVWAAERPKLVIPPLIDVGRGRPVRGWIFVLHKLSLTAVNWSMYGG